MGKIWMKNWPGYVPAEVSYPEGGKPLFEILRDNAGEQPEKVAIVFYGREITYKELDESSEKFARFLLESGFKKGDPIALFMPSCPQYHIAHYGINKMGGIIVPCSPLFKEWELTYELRDSGAKAIVALDLLHSVAAGACNECGIKNIIVTSMHDFLPKEPTMNLAPLMSFPKMTYPESIEFMDILSRYPADRVEAKVGLDDIVQLQYTGGTTGLPKGAILTHGSKRYKVAALMSIMRANAAYVGLPADNLSCLAILPTFHIAGMLGSVDNMIAMGSTQVLMVMFDPVAAMQAIDRYKLQFFQASVPMNLAIMDHPDRKKYDLSSLKLCLTTSFGVQLTEEIAGRWKEDTGGCVLVEAAYGLTETHTFDTFMPLNRPKYVAGCQGIPIPGQNLKIVSWEDRTKEVAPGEMGEIALNNPAVFKGYLNKPEETKNTLIDGWVYTGDMGKFDEDGYLYFLGRKKEMIKVSGFSVFPEEVETFLLQHEAVEKVAVVGVPDAKKGEVIKAYIVPKAAFKGKISAEDIISWAKQGISSYKVPNAVDFRDDLPMSMTGKVLRRILLEEELKKAG
ncbi:MAG: AMP-binding protein [Dehalococcoidia bacterium]|jgi:long-chain acyl-CoA synthetase